MINERICTSGGAPLDRTKELIEKASVVLVCLSQKYKNCPSCRAGKHYVRHSSADL